MIEYIDSKLLTPTMRDNRTEQIVQPERVDKSIINLDNINFIQDVTGAFFLRSQFSVIAVYYLEAQLPVYYEDDYDRVVAELKKYKILKEKNKLQSKFN